MLTLFTNHNNNRQQTQLSLHCLKCNLVNAGKITWDELFHVQWEILKELAMTDQVRCKNQLHRLVWGGWQNFANIFHTVREITFGKNVLF